MKKIISTLLLANLSLFALTLNETPKEVTLAGDNGGLVNGGDWNSSTIKDKLYVLLYVDPDKKDDNEAFIEALHQKNYDHEKFGTVAIINLKATWLPNFAIEKMLSKKQEEFPNTIYVKDKSKYLVNEWELADDSVNTLLFDKSGRLLYEHSGVIDDNEMKTIFELIEQNI